MNAKAVITIIKGSIANTLVFKGSFFIKMLTVILSEASSIYVMFIMLSKFQGYGDVTSGQFVFMYFFAHISYSLCMLLFKNLRTFGKAIQMGTFDKMLLMPIDTMTYVCAYNFDFGTIGQVVTSFLLFWVFRKSYGITWNIITVGYTMIMLVCSILILSAVLIVISSISYVTISWKPLDNMFGAYKEVLWYPLSIYNSVVQVILYTFIPLAYIAYVPMQLIFDVGSGSRTDVGVLALYLVASVVIFIGSYKFWYYQSSKYQSVG